MIRLWSAVTELIRRKAVHRKGFVCGEAGHRGIVISAGKELDELFEDTDSLEELADVFGCLVHLAVKKGWTPEMIEDKALEKLKQRFTFPDEVKPPIIDPNAEPEF